MSPHGDLRLSKTLAQRKGSCTSRSIPAPSQQCPGWWLKPSSLPSLGEASRFQPVAWSSGYPQFPSRTQLVSPGGHATSTALLPLENKQVILHINVTCQRRLHPLCWPYRVLTCSPLQAINSLHRARV